MKIFKYYFTETDKHYLLALLYATGIILFWRGIWEVSYEIPILDNVYVALFVGLLIITLTGLVYKEFDPLARKMAVITRIMHEIISEVKKGKVYDVHYYDELSKKHHRIDPKKIHRIEQTYVVVKEKGKEKFIPLHRISKIHHKRKIYWAR